MKRLLLSTLSLVVIAGGGTRLAAETAETPWQTCFNACTATHPGEEGYHYCRDDCRVFEPKEDEEAEATLN
ncbi:MAG TPA: hypothetical protein VHG51_21750 [Longimicrobiaceae bacterium]|nr:hypothetical protein [Longimicrobiaceae bacterium]